jgi:hypothetical protein
VGGRTVLFYSMILTYQPALNSHSTHPKDVRSKCLRCYPKDFLQVAQQKCFDQIEDDPSRLF